MQGLLALYLILVLVFPGCMMAPVALAPLFNKKEQPRPQPQAQAQTQPQTESTATQAKDPGQRLEQQKPGEIGGKP